MCVVDLDYGCDVLKLPSSQVWKNSCSLVHRRDWQSAVLMTIHCWPNAGVCFFFFISFNNEKQTNWFRYLKFHDWLQSIVR